MKRSAPLIWVKPPGPVASGLRIGLLGGSFNPAHEGHLYVSKVALDRLGLDYIWWLVAPQNPLKSARGMASLPVRVGRARALASHPRIRVTDIEVGLGTRYTVDTVTRLKRRFPQMRFVWIMGTDNLRDFSQWFRWPDLFATLPVAIVARPSSTLAGLYSKTAQRFARHRIKRELQLATCHPPAFVILDGPRCPMSATAIRQQRK